MWRSQRPLTRRGSTSSGNARALRGSGGLESRHDLRDPARLAARDQVDRAFVVERLDRLVQPDRDVVGGDDAAEPVDDLGELRNALGALARRIGPVIEPVTYRAGGGADGLTDLHIG